MSMAKLEEPKWTVVEFILTNSETKEISTVPVNWISVIDNETVCRWPNNKIRKHIKNASPPEDDWEVWPVKVLVQVYVSYKEAIKIERRKEMLSESESEILAKRMQKKRKIDSDFLSDLDCSDFDTVLSPVPQISKRRNTSASDDTLSVTSVDLMPPPPQPILTVEQEFQKNQDTSKIFIVENVPLFNNIQVEGVLNSEIQVDALEENVDVAPSVDALEENVDVTASITMADYRILVKKVNQILTNVTSNKLMLERIAATLQSQRGNNTENTVNNFDTIPQKQIKHYRKLMEYENCLQNSREAQKQLEIVFTLCGGINEGENVKRGLKKIWHDKLARKCSWYGRKDNYKIGNLKIIEILKCATRRNFPNITDKQFEKLTSAWFQQANLRYSRSAN